MNPDPLERFARGLFLAAGGLDFCTGLGLGFAPAQLLALMGVAAIGPEAAVYLRWIGAFVGAVGFVYLWALFRGERTRLRVTLELTIWFRLAAGAYSAWAIARGDLAAVWISVPLTDGALAAAQFWLLRRGVFR